MKNHKVKQLIMSIVGLCLLNACSGGGSGQEIRFLPESFLGAGSVQEKSLAMDEPEYPPHDEYCEDGPTFISTGPGDDEIIVKELGPEGLLVRVNGEETTLELSETECHVVVRSEGGNDNIRVERTSGAYMYGVLFIEGGAGDDSVYVDETSVYKTQVDLGVGMDILTRYSSDAGVPVLVEFKANEKSNIINISEGSGGEILIKTAGQRYELDPGTRKVMVRGAGGNDAIIVNSRVTRTLELYGDAGNDLLVGAQGNDLMFGGQGNDVLLGGPGADSLHGGAGNDELRGQAGSDVIYGLSGNDRLSGGEGRDYLDGGPGQDVLMGGGQGDALIGGNGSDLLQGGDGVDVLAGGPGLDVYQGGPAADRLYHQAEDLTLAGPDDELVEVDLSVEVGNSLELKGVDENKEILLSDLTALRSLPSGRGFLAELDRVTLVHSLSVEAVYAHSNAGFVRFESQADAKIRSDFITPGPGTSVQVEYGATSMFMNHGTEEWMLLRPITTLYHELSHAYNGLTGTTPLGETFDPEHNQSTRNSELIATGLPIDHDGDPNTPLLIPGDNLYNPYYENMLRLELGFLERIRYY